MKKINFYFLFYFLFFFGLFSNAQSVIRECVGSAGTNSVKVENVSVQQTAGQSYSTVAYYDDEGGIRPGFQQYSKFMIDLTESTFNVNLNLYPNPATYSVTIESSEMIANAQLIISDLNGKIMYSENFSELSILSVNCDTWANGMYFISLSDENNNSCSSRLIINK